MVNSNLWHHDEAPTFLYGYKMPAIENPINPTNFFDKIDEGSPTAIESGDFSPKRDLFNIIPRKHYRQYEIILLSVKSGYKIL